MRPRLIILGGGDFVREVIWLAGEIPQTEREWTLAGVLSDFPDRARATLQSCGFSEPVLGNISEYVPQAGDRFICAIGEPRTKLDVTQRVKARGGKFVNLIHPTAAIGPNSQLGEGIILTRNCIVTTNVTIGDHVCFNLNSDAGHDAVIEDGCTLSSHCEIAGHAHLERGVFLGSHASVMPGVRIGSFAVIGAGSVAFRGVKSGQTVVGVPAKALL